MMQYDPYREVVNGEGTYRAIAEHLRQEESVLVGWTDGQMTHLDILFSVNPVAYGSNIQGGVRPRDLFVSVMRWGSFGFELNTDDTHPGYIDEKLGNRASFGPTAEPLAELINGVKKAYNDN